MRPLRREFLFLVGWVGLMGLKLQTLGLDCRGRKLESVELIYWGCVQDSDNVSYYSLRRIERASSGKLFLYDAEKPIYGSDGKDEKGELLGNTSNLSVSCI